VRATIECQPTREEIFRFAWAGGSSCAASPSRAPPEDIFIDLTTTDPAVPHAEASGTGLSESGDPEGATA
jgi:hypothetical protein